MGLLGNRGILTFQMSESGPVDVVKTPGWQCGNVWARPEMFGANPVKQLIVPSSMFSAVSGRNGALEVANNYGSWAAATADRPLADDRLWARLQLGAEPGDPLAAASWNVPKPLLRSSPGTVLDSYSDALTFSEESKDRPGLRSPQLGAVHAVLGYWTTRRSTPATVVMPTGTGKTETMLALLVAARLPRLLVLVPSDALREQVAGKFETLGVLQELGIVNNQALRPVVGRVLHGFAEQEAAAAFAGACNVIVATPQSLGASDPEALAVLLGACSHLFVDEAHHVAARTWSAVRDEFAGKEVVQFTATPFREDGRHLQGRVIYSFPLREAQIQRYFSQIDYTSVIDFEDVDRALAKQSIAKLRSDLAEGYDHILMARVSGIPRAKEIKELYDTLAPDLAPVIVNYQMPKGYQRDALQSLSERNSRIIVCVTCWARASTSRRSRSPLSMTRKRAWL